MMSYFASNSLSSSTVSVFGNGDDGVANRWAHPHGMGFIYNADSLAFLKELPDKQFDLVFADPPYNLQLKKDPLYRPDGSVYNGVRDDWDAFNSYEEYDAFTVSWLSEVKRLLNTDATLAVMGSYHNIHRIAKILQDLDFWIINEIVWIKHNPTPNFRGVRLTNAQEYIVWAKPRQSKKYFFNYEILKKINGGKQMRSDWYFPICQGRERLKDQANHSIHSTQKPLPLLLRFVLMACPLGGWVLDPFFGTGTTGVASALLNRYYVGVEKDPRYFSASIQRLNIVIPRIESDEEILNGTAPTDILQMLITKEKQ